MDPSIIEQDNARHRVRLVSYPIKKGDYIMTRGRPLLSSPDQLAIAAQCPKHVDVVPVRQWFDWARLADPSPAILHRRIWAETRFVEIQQFALMLTVEPSQVPNHPGSTFEGLLVAFSNPYL